VLDVHRRNPSAELRFLKAGFVAQDAGSEYYELGPPARQLGLAKLRRLDAVKEASPSSWSCASKLTKRRSGRVGQFRTLDDPIEGTVRM